MNNEKLCDMGIDDKDYNSDFEKVKYINKATFPNLSTPLMKAATNGHVACVRVLILAGADKELKNASDQTAKTLVLQKKGQILGLIKSSKERLEGAVDAPSAQSHEGETANKPADETSLSIFKDSVNHYIDLLERLEKCQKALDMTPEEIRTEDSAEVMLFDASRKESHLKTFESQALTLKQELERLIDNSKDSWCDHKSTSPVKKDEVVRKVVRQFKDLLDKHKTRNPKWYNDGGKYRSAVSEMLSMKENAMAVPRLSKAMFDEWESKQTFLRQANRMVTRESLRALREMLEGSEERKTAALELCKSAGIVTELLEEKNEMSETPLIREVTQYIFRSLFGKEIFLSPKSANVQAADGNPKNLLLLLEAGADVNAKQDHKIGFTAMNQAAYFGHAPCLRHLLRFKADVNIVDAYGGTPLVAAALNGEEECVRVLLEAGANVNQPTTNGNTPLMKAALNGHAKCVRMLIVAGADVALKNKKSKDAEGKDALTLAKEAIGPVIDELVEFQEEHFEPKSHAVTYDGLKDLGFDSYMWDASIEPTGGFVYVKENGGEKIEQPIDLSDIGDINKCEQGRIFSFKTDISGLSKVSDSITRRFSHSIDKDTTYGWDHEANCWTYFTDPSSDSPTFYAEYTKKCLHESQKGAIRVTRKRQKFSSTEKIFREKKRASLYKVKENYKDCIQALGMKVEAIQEEDWARINEKDSTRKDSHMRTFEMQALVLKRELQEFINTSTSEFCCDVKNQERQDTLDQVVHQFMMVKQKHQERSPKWYNDDGRYRSGVIEMLSMKDNAMAVPRLTITMYQEWKSKQSFLRQADRMVSRERFR